MEGHAGYAARGSDIVCAAASILFYTLANYLSARKEAEVQVTKRNGDAPVSYTHLELFLLGDLADKLGRMEDEEEKRRKKR